MTHQIFNVPPQQPLSAAGRTLPGAKASFFLTTTDTPVNVWTTSALNVAHPVPVVADAGGRFPAIFLDPAVTYKVTITDASDVLLYTIDPCNDVLNLFPLTDAEDDAGVTPVNYSYPERHIYRYQTNTTPGTTDMATGLAAAIAVAQASGDFHNPTVLADPGLYAIATTVTISGANQGITIACTEPCSLQNGSVLPAVTFRWTGGASAMLDIQTSFCGFQFIAFENYGTGTYCFKLAGSSGRFKLKGCSFVFSGGTRWSSGVVDCTTAPIDYSFFEELEIATPAPVFFNYDGNNPGSGITTLEFDRLIADCSGADFTLIKFVDGGADRIHIHDSTFNTQSDHSYCILDASGIGSTDNIIQTLDMENVEWDNDSNVTTARMLKLKNVKSANVDNLQIVGGGFITAAIDLTNSVLHVGKLYARTIDGPLVDLLDSVSQVWADPTALDVSNTKGITLETSGICGQVDITYATTCNVLLHLAQPNAPTVFCITANDGVAFAVELPDHLSSPPNATFRTRGQIFGVRIKNSRSAGNALGAITFGAAFTLKGTVIGPGAGKELTVWFVWDGTTASEIGRGDAESGSGTFTLTGCTTSPTQTFHYARNGDQCVVAIDSSLTATSNSAAKTLTNANTLPVSMWPARAQVCVCRTFDNGVGTVGLASIGTDGVITLGKEFTTGTGGFTGSGTAGIGGACVLTWLRN
jgi:hypothetical protein